MYSIRSGSRGGAEKVTGPVPEHGRPKIASPLGTGAGVRVAVGAGVGVRIALGAGVGVGVAVGASGRGDGVGVAVGWRATWGDGTRDFEEVGVTDGTGTTVVRSVGWACRSTVVIEGAEGLGGCAGGAVESMGAGLTPGVAVLHAASTMRPANNAAREIPGRAMGLFSRARRTAS